MPRSPPHPHNLVPLGIAVVAGGASLAAAFWEGIAGGAGAADAPLVLLNTTASLPLGLYRRIHTTPRPGVLIAFREPLSRPAEHRRLFLKPVLAGRGQHVCADGARVTVDGRTVAPVLPEDSHGRPLTSWGHCLTLAGGELFVLSTYSPRSYDSRYYGPIPTAEVVGAYAPAVVTAWRPG